MDPTFGIKFFGALFAVMNPLIVLPIFLGLTGDLSLGEQRRTAVSSVAYAAVMCLVVGLAGQQILSFFGINIDNFRVAGGMVLTGIALSMLNGKSSPTHAGNDQERTDFEASENISFYPMTFPIIVGPGTIATLVVFFQQARTPADWLTCAAVLAAVLVILLVVLYFAASIGKRLSRTLRVIVTRVMGIILLAIAINMFGAGLVKMLPGLGATLAVAT